MADRSSDLPGGVQVRWNTFLDIPPAAGTLETARVVVIPVPYDATTSYRGGARDGPGAIIAASRHLEEYDIELDRDISTMGIHTTPEIQPDVSGPKALVAQVRSAVQAVASRGKLPVLLGGEHTIAIGAVQALARVYPGLSVQYLDAHADLRDSYMGSRWGHASVARRLREAVPLTLVGVRSISQDEMGFVRDSETPVHFWPPAGGGVPELAAAVLSSLSDKVYVSLDLDVMDPSVMSAVGTPEPGGISWLEVTCLLRRVAEQRRIVGFDVTELSPAEGPEACAFTAAKVAYKLMGYATMREAWRGSRTGEMSST